MSNFYDNAHKLMGDRIEVFADELNSALDKLGITGKAFTAFDHLRKNIDSLIADTSLLLYHDLPFTESLQMYGNMLKGMSIALAYASETINVFNGLDPEDIESLLKDVLNDREEK